MNELLADPVLALVVIIGACATVWFACDAYMRMVERTEKAREEYRRRHIRMRLGAELRTEGGHTLRVVRVSPGRRRSLVHCDICAFGDGRPVEWPFPCVTKHIDHPFLCGNAEETGLVAVREDDIPVLAVRGDLA